jgi:hypothetical protein
VGQTVASVNVETQSSLGQVVTKGASDSTVSSATQKNNRAKKNESDATSTHPGGDAATSISSSSTQAASVQGNSHADKAGDSGGRPENSEYTDSWNTGSSNVSDEGAYTP